MLGFYKFHHNAVTPERAYSGDAGYDLASVEPVTVPARGKALIKTGLGVVFGLKDVQNTFGPQYSVYGRIAPRSGMSWKHHTDVGAGVIDAGYRGEIGVVLFNHSDSELHLEAGTRVAQLIVTVVALPKVVEISKDIFESTQDILSDPSTTCRGERSANGYGSSDVAI